MINIARADCDEASPPSYSSEYDCNDICRELVVGSETHVICDTYYNDDDSLGPAYEDDYAGGATAIYDRLGDLCVKQGGISGAKYCAWGTDSEGEQFYCEWDDIDETLTEVHLLGGDEKDSLFFWYYDGNDTYNLTEWWTSSGFTVFKGRQFGKDGDDVMQGSWHGASTEYVDILNGGEDGDHICGLDGDDVLSAGPGTDWLEGGDGDDSLSGGGDDDLLCGGLGIDSLDGGSGPDELSHGADGTESNNGGPGTDECNSGADPNCESGWSFGDPC